jgi:hypothetical protein
MIYCESFCKCHNVPEGKNNIIKNVKKKNFYYSVKFMNLTKWVWICVCVYISFLTDLV